MALVVVATVSALVVLGITAVTGAGGEATSGQARQAAATTGADSGTAEPGGSGSGSASAAPATPSASAAEPTLTKKERRAARRAARREAAQESTLGSLPTQPQGACEPRTVRISSRVSDAFAGTDVTVPLDVITLGQAACTWTFSADTVALDITSGDDRVWTSVQCPGQLPREELVLVPGRSSSLQFTWHGRRSDATCSRAAGYAYPGWYHVLVAAQGGEPYDQQFELTKAPDEVRTRTPQPKPRAQKPQQSSSQTDAQTETESEDAVEGRTQSSGRAGD